MRAGRFGEYGQGESVAMLHGIIVSTYPSELWSPNLQVILDRLVGSLAARDSSLAREQGWFLQLGVTAKERGREKEEGGRVGRRETLST